MDKCKREGCEVKETRIKGYCSTHCKDIGWADIDIKELEGKLDVVSKHAKIISDENDALHEQIATLQAQLEWVSVSDRAPFEGYYLVYGDVVDSRGTHRFVDKGYYHSDTKIWDVIGLDMYKIEVIGYMPFPTAPK